MLEDILADAMTRQWEYGMRVNGEEGGEVAVSNSGSNGSWYAGTEIGDAWVSK